MSQTEIYIHFTIIYKLYWGAASVCGYVCCVTKNYKHMKTVFVILALITFLTCLPQVSAQPVGKTSQPKELAMVSKKNWLPSSIKPTMNGNNLVALPLARITKNHQNKNKTVVENLVIKSTDSGQTWQDVSEGLPENLQEGFFSTNFGVYLRAGDGIYHNNLNSTGSHWLKERCPDTFTSIAPAKGGLIAYNYAGQFVQKVNGTNAWTPLFLNFKEQLVRGVFETSTGVFFIGSDKGLFRSTTNGKTWKKVQDGGWAMKLVEVNGVLLATNQQGIIRSIDGGENWEMVISEGGVGIAIEPINGGVAAITYNTESKTRRVRTSFDNGKNWQAIDGGLPADASIASIVQFGNDLFCGHPSGIFRSSDLGKTWKLLLPAVENKVYNLSVSGSVIYAVLRSGGC
jgi:photosystem II stability/assembly factor-like uncharacterized protein